MVDTVWVAARESFPPHLQLFVGKFYTVLARATSSSPASVGNASVLVKTVKSATMIALTFILNRVKPELGK